MPLPVRSLLLTALAFLVVVMPGIARAAAPPRLPVFGDERVLSLSPDSRTYPPAADFDGGTGFVAYDESTLGIVGHRITAQGTRVGPQLDLSRGRVWADDGPVVAVSGRHVYVGWVAGSELEVVASDDGGETFGLPQVVAEGADIDGIRLAADGDTVFAMWVQTAPRRFYDDGLGSLHTAGSRDGGRTWPCRRQLSASGDRMRWGFDVAVTGDTVVWSWSNQVDELRVRRSEDAGRTVQATETVAQRGSQETGPLELDADGDTVAIVFGDGDAAVATSADRGRTFSVQPLAVEANRCQKHHLCPGNADVSVAGDVVLVAWRGTDHQMHLRRSDDAGAAFDGPVDLGPWTTATTPTVAAFRNTVAVSWYINAAPGQPFDLDPVTAFSSDAGKTFTLHTIEQGTERAGALVAPMIFEGDGLQGAGFAWMSWTPGALYHSDLDVRFRPLTNASQDLEVLGVRTVQAARDATRLVAGKPVDVQVDVRAVVAERTRVPVRVDVTYRGKDGPVTRRLEEDRLLSPGTTTLHFGGADLVPEAGALSARAELDPAGTLGDPDRSNNVGDAHTGVAQGRDLTIAFIGVAEPGATDAPTCRDIGAVTAGAAEQLGASWPIDPRRVAWTPVCGAPLRVPRLGGEAALTGADGLLAQLDRLAIGAKADKIVGVVPRGWFDRQGIDKLKDAVGVSVVGGAWNSVLVERQATGGWLVGHELAHQLGWAPPGPHGRHLESEPAPGRWVAQNREIADDTIDFMHYSDAGASLADPVGRWTSRKTWDYLADLLTIPAAGARAAAAAADQAVLDVSGTVDGDGAQLAPVWTATGGERGTAPGGALTLEQRGADGGLLASARFDTAEDLDAADGEEVHLAAQPFALRVVAQSGVASVRVVRDGHVLATRTRSAHAPEVTITAPAAGATVTPGGTIAVRWTATDADGDALTHQAALSADGGATWRPLPGAGDGELTLQATSDLAGKDVLVRVVTSDGWNTTTTTAPSFAVTSGVTDGRIAYTVDNFSTNTYKVVTADLDGSDRKVIADAFERYRADAKPRFSPDGRRIAITGFDHRSLITFDPDGGHPHSVATPDGILDPVWAPDGRVLARLGEWAVGAFDPETGDKAPFAAGLPCDFSADGTELIGWTTYPGFALSRADGSEPRKIPSPDVDWSGCASLSPDGTQAVAIGRDQGPDTTNCPPDEAQHWICFDGQPVIIDVRTGATHRITTKTFHGQWNLAPTWSPSGKWIYVVSGDGTPGDSGGQLWRMHPDGTGVELVVAAGDGERVNPADVQPVLAAAPDSDPTPAQQRPHADAGGPYWAAEGEAITLDGRASAPGASKSPIKTIKWDLDLDGAFDDATGERPEVTFPDNGTYRVAVEVTDADGAVDIAQAEVRVRNVDPTVTATRSEGNDVEVGADISDPGHDTFTAEILWDDGSAVEAVPVAQDGDGHGRLVATHQFAAGGGHTVTITVRDDDGGRTETSATVVQPAPNHAPEAHDAELAVPHDAGASLDLPVDDADGEPLTVEIVQAPEHGSVTVAPGELGPRGVPRVDYGPTAGAHGSDRFTYRVGDGRDWSAPATVSVTIADAAEHGATGDEPLAESAAPPGAPSASPAPRPSHSGSKPPTGGDDVTATDKPGTTETPAALGARVLQLPSARSCVSRRRLRIHLRGVKARTVRAWVDGRRVAVTRRSSVAVDLRGLPKGRYRVRVEVTLTDGRKATVTRRYRTCTARKTPKGA